MKREYTKRKFQIDGDTYEVQSWEIETWRDMMNLHRPNAAGNEYGLRGKLPNGHRVKLWLDDEVDWELEVERYETVPLRAQQG